VTFRTRVAQALMLVALCGGAACGRGGQSPQPAQQTRVLRGVKMPDVSKMSAPVQTQVRARFGGLEAKTHQAAREADLATAYGEVGELLLAAHYLDDAEPALLNARDLAPNDPTWPYYLAHLYRMRGALDQAAASFREVLTRQSDSVPARVWLASVYIDQGRYDDAQPLLDAVVQQNPRLPAALFHLGRVALARRDFSRAVSLLEQVAGNDPSTTAVHYPLAIAYRGAGRPADSDRQLRLRDQRNTEIMPPDPLMDRLADLLEGQQAFEVRGTEALAKGEWRKAIETFRRGVAVAPQDPLLRHRLATALYMAGEVAEAEREFADVAERSPNYAPAQYSLGVLLESHGRDAEAADHYAAAVKYQPTYVQARMRLAGTLRRSGRATEALEHYEGVTKIDPRLADAAIETAVTLVRLNRYSEARDRLIVGMNTFPGHPGFPSALARLLAAAPDDRVRDGRRALALAQNLVKTDQSIEIGETLAMALAETGQYADAAGIQRDLIAAARGAGRSDLASRLEENLRLYESRHPCRTPWRQEDVGDVSAAVPDAIRAAVAAK
jgi:tetratricopeptide (TPR) repeat protein